MINSENIREKYRLKQFKKSDFIDKHYKNTNVITPFILGYFYTKSEEYCFELSYSNSNNNLLISDSNLLVGVTISNIKEDKLEPELSNCFNSFEEAISYTLKL